MGGNCRCDTGLIQAGVVEPGGAGAGEAHLEPDIRVSRSGGGSDRQGFPDSAGICSGYGFPGFVGIGTVFQKQDGQGSGIGSLDIYTAGVSLTGSGGYGEVFGQPAGERGRTAGGNNFDGPAGVSAFSGRCPGERSGAIGIGEVVEIWISFEVGVFEEI